MPWRNKTFTSTRICHEETKPLLPLVYAMKRQNPSLPLEYAMKRQNLYFHWYIPLRDKTFTSTGICHEETRSLLPLVYAVKRQNLYFHWYMPWRGKTFNLYFHWYMVWRRRRRCEESLLAIPDHSKRNRFKSIYLIYHLMFFFRFQCGAHQMNKNQKWVPLRAMKTFIRKKMGHTT